MLKVLYAPVGFGLVCLTLGWSACRSGLFFDSELYGLEKILFIGTVLWIGIAWVAGQRTIRLGTMVFPLSLAGLYGLSVLVNPVSVQGSVDAALRWMTYACFGVLVTALWQEQRNREWGKAAIQATGLLLLISGWLGWFGWITPPNIVLRFNDPALSATGARLAGYLQYPNTYGALLAAFLLMQLQAWTDNASKRWQAWVATVTANLYGGALLLTESRGAVAALFIGIAIALLLAAADRRRQWAMAIGMTVGGSALMAAIGWHWMPAADRAADGGMAIGTLAALACGVGLAATMSFVRSRFREGNGYSRVVNAVLSWSAVGSGLAAAVWLWKGTDGERLTGHMETAASRWLFYQDGWRMFLDRPWFGYGGDSWRSMLTLYQSEPYVGNEVHSGYLSLLLDTGIAGLTLLLFFLGTSLYAVWKREKAALAPAIVLLAHAVIDFDWSYAFVWLLLIAWLRVHAVGVPAVASGLPAGARYAAPGGWRRLGRAGLAALLAIGAAAGLWAATRSDAAAQAFGEAAIAPTPQARAAHLRAALEANPAFARIRLGLAPLLATRERASLLAAGLRYDPQSAPLWLQLGIAYAELGDGAQTRSSLREALRLDRYSREGQTAALAAVASLAESRLEAGDASAAEEAAAAGAAFFASYRELARQVAAMAHPANDRQFALTVAAQYHAARCLIILGRRGEADELLREIVRVNDGDWKQMALELLDE